MMEILLNPNVAYVILAFSLMITILALLSPGTGILELAALLSLGVVAYLAIQLTFNYWAVGALLAGIVIFIIAIRRKDPRPFLILSIILLIVGSAYLIANPENPLIPAVNPFLAVIVSVLMAGFFWIAAIKIIEARKERPVHDMENLVGKVGEAKSEILNEGSVQVSGELWSARSENRIPSGARVRVVNLEGFILMVELIPDQAQEPEKAI